MFTGIVDNEGIVIKKESRGGQIRFGFSFKKKDNRFKIGDSMAVDGVCLTAVKISKKGFEVDVVRETLQATTLGDLKIGGKVNLEKSLKYGDFLGGHFVSGHIDGLGTIVKIEKDKKNSTLSISAPKDIINLLAAKGSVACDGISLTIQSMKGKIFKIAVIPHTLQETTLGLKKAGSKVNIEVDILIRYLQECFVKQGKKIRIPQIPLRELLEQGF